MLTKGSRQRVPGLIRSGRLVGASIFVLEAVFVLGHVGASVEVVGDGVSIVVWISAAIFVLEAVDIFELLEALVQEFESTLVKKAFLAAGRNQSRGARLLGLNRDKFRYRMKQYGIKEDEES